MDLNKARFNMIEQQVRPWEVLDPQVLELLMAVRREDFVPAAHRALAFVDMEIPTGNAPGQVMLAPRVQARLVQDLAVKKTDKVLEIGTGSGYLTALIAQSCAHVTSLECQPDLLAQAQQNLRHLGIHNVDLQISQGVPTHVKGAPFDAIVLSGSVAEVPQHLLNQLKLGGQLIAIVGQEPVMQATLTQRVSEQQWRSRALWDICVPALVGFPQPSRFKF